MEESEKKAANCVRAMILVTEKNLLNSAFQGSEESHREHTGGHDPILGESRVQG